MSLSLEKLRFEFVNYSGETRSHHDKARFREIKQHVMKNHFRKQFALDERHAKRNMIRRRLAPVISAPQESEPIDRDSTHACIDVATGRHVCCSYQSKQLTSACDQTGGVLLPATSKASLVSLDGANFDPFDTIPLALSKASTAGVRWFFVDDDRSPICNTGLPWLYLKNMQWKGHLWTAASQYPGIFHILITLGQANRARLTGTTDTVSWLFHKGQSIKVLREGLTGKDALISDGLVLLISSQISLAMVGDLAQGHNAVTKYEAADTHRRALLKLLNERGGISSITGYMALHHMVWSDLRLAAGTLTKPQLPRDPRMSCKVFSPRFVREAERRTAAVVSWLPASGRTSEVRRVFGYLQYMSLSFDEVYGREVQADGAMNPCYQGLHHLYHILPLSYMRREGQETSGLSDSFNALYAVLLAAGICAWTWIPKQWPEVHHSHLVHDIVAVHVQELWNCLSQSQDPCKAWRETGAGLESLLWVAYRGLNMAIVLKDTARPGQMRDKTAWFLDLLNQVAGEMSMSKLGAALEIFPQSDPFPNTSGQALAEGVTRRCDQQWSFSGEKLLKE
ncbi:hypothetical protein AAFC00_006846 [Neodothiora populina]|uniref:Uncharacterized protein n=1 Tax=Neodothiora populina TaxID=2781224 RepID=A0ABR3PBD0_9PEZI